LGVLPLLSLNSVRSKDITNDQKKVLAQIVRFYTVKNIHVDPDPIRIVKSTLGLDTVKNIRDYHNRLIQSAFKTPSPGAKHGML
jgi:hypothetical protein